MVDTLGKVHLSLSRHENSYLRARHFRPDLCRACSSTGIYSTTLRYNHYFLHHAAGQPLLIHLPSCV